MQEHRNVSIQTGLIIPEPLRILIVVAVTNQQQEVRLTNVALLRFTVAVKMLVGAKAEPVLHRQQKEVLTQLLAIIEVAERIAVQIHSVASQVVQHLKVVQVPAEALHLLFVRHPVHLLKDPQAVVIAEVQVVAQKGHRAKEVAVLAINSLEIH
tara:strand:- start:213 stop:674 length:462 start_codon:yes stop_codon:yes gene_type:complete